LTAAEHTIDAAAACTVRVVNPKGLHARPASKVAKLTTSYDAVVFVACNDEIAEADSIMDLLMLGAAPGADLKIAARGSDAAAAVEAVADLVRRGFDEI